MKESVLFSTPQFKWIDFEGPSPAHLDQLGERFGLHKTSIHDCLDPEHLPKYEFIDGLHFVILRVPEMSPPVKGVSVQDLTRKIAIFVGNDFLITVHRAHLDLIHESKLVAEHFKDPIELLSLLINATLKKYEQQIDRFFLDLEGHEASVFSVDGAKPFKLKSAYYLKRKTFVFKLLLKMLQDVAMRLNQNPQAVAPTLQDLKENCGSVYFYADELYENITTLINLHVSLATQKTTEASYKTGEIVRVLTVFSIFLLPLNVVTGIYGMNFEVMPELKSPWGYPGALLAMLSIVVGIYWIMTKKGWLK